MKRLSLLSACLLFAHTVVLSQVTNHEDVLQEYTLPNGLKVYPMPDPLDPNTERFISPVFRNFQPQAQPCL